MRFGLTLAPRSSLDELIRTAVAAERAGFDTLYLTERHFDASSGFANVFAAATALSGHLSTAWIGVRPALGLDHPLRVVEQSNLLDVLTRGRCLIVLVDPVDTAPYSAFGVPAPRNDRLEDLIDRMVDAWTWVYREEGPPLAFDSGPYSARMAGRVMPAASREPHPLLAREADTEAPLMDAARRGWPVQVRGAAELCKTYRRVLMSAGHAESTVDECSTWLTGVVDVCTATGASERMARVRQFVDAGAARIRFDLAAGVTIDDVLNLRQPDVVRTT